MHSTYLPVWIRCLIFQYDVTVVVCILGYTRAFNHACGFDYYNVGIEVCIPASGVLRHLIVVWVGRSLFKSMLVLPEVLRV